MDSETLKTFLTLADNLNFTKTADSLFVAQSTVTNRIAELEKEIGKKLFSRNKRSVTLTKEGILFINYAKRILELENTCIKDINSLNKYEKILRLGTTNTIYECYLIPIIKDYINKHPHNGIKITISHSNDLIKSLQDNILDVAYSYLPLNKPDYTCERFAVDNLLLVTNTSNKEYKRGIYKKQLTGTNYLFCNFALQEVGIYIKELFPPYYQFGFEIDNSTKLIPYLLEMNGISFVPDSLAKPYITENKLYEIPLLDFNPPKINCYKITRKYK